MESIALIVRELWSNKAIRISTIVIFSVFIIWTIVYLLLLPPKIIAKQTNISLDTNMQIVKDKLMLYNGSSFYQVNPATSSDPKVVYSPKTRLPHVSGVIWANDRGVLLNFDRGIIYTPVFDYLLENNLPLAATSYGTWYLDFKSGELARVNDSDFKHDLGFYDENNNTFYFLPVGEYSEFKSLIAYKVDTKEVTTIIEDLDFNYISTLDGCGGKLCISGNKNDQTIEEYGIYSIDVKSKSIKREKAGKGFVSQKHNDDFIIFEEPVDEGDVETTYRKLTNYNIVDKSENSFPGVFSEYGLFKGSIHENNYYLDGGSSSYLLSSKDIFGNYNLKEAPIQPSDDTDFTHGFISISQTNYDMTIIGSLDRKYFILADDSFIKNSFTKQSKKDTDSFISECAKSASALSEFRDETNEYTITVTDGDGVSSAISKINQCIASKPKFLLGNQFYFQARDPENGKITTD